MSHQPNTPKETMYVVSIDFLPKYNNSPQIILIVQLYPSPTHSHPLPFVLFSKQLKGNARNELDFGIQEDRLMGLGSMSRF